MTYREGITVSAYRDLPVLKKTEAKAILDKVEHHFNYKI